MANKSLFSSFSSLFSPVTNAFNRMNAPAYAYDLEHSLAQLAATGTLHDNFYTTAETQLADVLRVAKAVEPLFVAQVALYARQRGIMKDMPALLTAYLTVVEPQLAVKIFDRVIDNGRMLRTFVQIMRSGAVGRQSLGTRPKKLVQQWLERASMTTLMQAATGRDPSLADIVKMVHPRPADPQRRAFYGWLLGRPYDAAVLPPEIAAFEQWKQDRSQPVPPVPFAWLTSSPLTAAQWAALVPNMGWHALRMNLNTLARHGAFQDGSLTSLVAARLRDPDTLAKARVLPYQLLAALGAVDRRVPLTVQGALEEALENRLALVPEIAGQVVVCPDVSGSMRSPITGQQAGGVSSSVRCIDVAALIAAAIMRRNPQTLVLPFEREVIPLTLDPFARVAVNAGVLAAIGGGGTNVSAPLFWLNAMRRKVDMVILVSDNESWMDPRLGAATETMRQWAALKRRNPKARLVCIDLQPYGTTQAQSRSDILNIGGFSDAVFDTLAQFANGKTQNWLAQVKAVAV